MPKLKDVDTSMKLLSQLGAKVERNGFVVLMPATLMCLLRTLIHFNHTYSIWALGRW